MIINDMELITSFGTLTINGQLTGSLDNYSLEVDDYEFSDEAANIIGKCYEAAMIFFAEEIDISDEDIDDDVQVELIEILAQSSYSDVARALAIKEFTGDDFADITENGEDTFEVSGSEYLVLTDDEADVKALEYATNNVEEFGIDGVQDWAKEHALSNFVDTDWFEDAMKESSESHAYDIKEEGADEPYVNRLHEEMVDEGIMDEPEWPEEPDEDDFAYEREDFEREDFDEDEPTEDEFDTEEEWQEAHDEWEDNQSTFESEQDDAESDHDNEQDEAEAQAQEEYDNAVQEWETETEDYRSELEADAENNIDEFVEKRIDGEDGYEWWDSNIGNTEQVVKDNGLLDEEAFAEWLVDQDGRGHYITNYDGEENEETITYRGETETYYIYRIS